MITHEKLEELEKAAHAQMELNHKNYKDQLEIIAMCRWCLRKSTSETNLTLVVPNERT